MNCPIYISGVLFKTLLNHQNVQNKPKQVVNIDFSNITIYDTTFINNNMFIFLHQKINELIKKEVAIYKSVGIYPYHQIQNLIWKFIFGILIIASGKINADFNDENFIQNVFHEISSRKISNVNSLEYLICKSKVIEEFIKDSKQGSEVYRKMFAQVKQMENVIKFVRKQK